jgi:hypothetical protein
MKSMRFIEFIEEDDGSTTMVAADASGQLHEFRGVKITYTEEQDTDESNSVSLSFVVHEES